jgi:DNA polymerase III subunit delta
VILVLYGANELTLKRRMAELREQADGGSGMLESNFNTVDGRDAKAADIIAPVMSMPFLAPHRLVVVEHFLERFEVRLDRTQPRSLQPFDPLFAALEAGIPESTILVFLGQPFLQGPLKRHVSSGNPMVKRLAQIKGATTDEHAELKPRELVDAIRAEANRRGVRLRPGRPAERLQPGEVLPQESDPADLIAKLVQGDMLSVANELDKLALYAPGQEVSVVEVNRVCAGERVSTEFEFVDAVMDGDLGKALEAIVRLKRDGANLQGMLALLLTGYRRTATILDLLDQNAHAEDIGKAMGAAGKWPNLRDNAIRRARALGQANLHEAYEAIVHFERTFKQGEVDEEVGFDILVMRLASLTGSLARRR